MVASCPTPTKKKKNEIGVLSALGKGGTAISVTTHKTIHFLPLIIYWSDEFRRTTTLNNQIAVTCITNSINSYNNKKLSDKLNGKKLELTIGQTPISFSTVDKEHIIFPLFGWFKYYGETDLKDLVISYKLMNNEVVEKSGKIEQKNDFSKKGIRYFQSLRSIINEFISEYESNLKAMTKELMNKLTEEL